LQNTFRYVNIHIDPLKNKGDTDMEKRLLTVNEAADYLRVQPRTIRKWLREARLPAVKAGRLWRIEEDALSAYVKGNK
jgi:excisionase family DNA binding protein